MKILIFTEGTAIMHASALHATREERVRQSANETEGIDNFVAYIPNGNVVRKLKSWKNQGAQIYYLTSRRTPKEVEDIRFVLRSFYFPDPQNVFFRKEEQDYKDVAHELMPDILIEDDCESIGGEAEMTYPHMDPERKLKVRSIVVKEFEGIDLLPDDLRLLQSIEGRPSRKES